MHSRPAVTQVTQWNKAERNPAHETVIANGWGIDKFILKGLTTGEVRDPLSGREGPYFRLTL